MEMTGPVATETASTMNGKGHAVHRACSSPVRCLRPRRKNAAHTAVVTRVCCRSPHERPSAGWPADTELAAVGGASPQWCGATRRSTRKLPHAPSSTNSPEASAAQ